jgi:hypothetical protein
MVVTPSTAVSARGTAETESGSGRISRTRASGNAHYHERVRGRGFRFGCRRRLGSLASRRRAGRGAALAEIAPQQRVRVEDARRARPAGAAKHAAQHRGIDA